MRRAPGVLQAGVAMLLAGCAATGPKVNSQELAQARAWLKTRAVLYKHEQLRRVNRLGYRLVAVIPEDPFTSHKAAETRAYPFAGWLVTELKKDTALAYGLPPLLKGVLIAGVLPGSPAERAGVQAGDALIQLNERPLASPRQLASAMRAMQPGERVTVTYQRRETTHTTTFSMEAVPRAIAFHMTEDTDVNAFAAPGGLITVTYGMMRFVHSDDELAVVLGHELAHVTRGHVAKNAGTSVVAGLLGGAVGGTIDLFVPGLGTLVGSRVSRVIQGQFSQDWEREADFVGLTYVHRAGFEVHSAWRIWERFSIEVPGGFSSRLLSTHPTSPERMVRLQKAAYALVHGLPLETIDTAQIPLELDPAAASAPTPE